jgi:hypothetical protein
MIVFRYEPTSSRILGGPSATPEPDVEQIRFAATVPRKRRSHWAKSRDRPGMRAFLLAKAGVNRLAQAQEKFARVRELQMLELSIEALVLLPRLLKDR